MDQAALTGIFAQRPERFAWFVGAGASRSSGLPTATDLLNDLKRQYYRQQENQELRLEDMQNAAIAARVQAFVESRGFPGQWADDEYSTYFDRMFTDKKRQRDYLSRMLSEEKVSLAVGSRVLAALMAWKRTRVVFTTNFDSVIEKAIASVANASLAAYHIEGAANAKHALDNEEYPFYCKIHGDFRYDSIKNLSADLAAQNEELSQCMVNAGNRFGFLVAGYSGRDKSVMDLFHKVLDSPNPFPHGLYWTSIKNTPAAPAVQRLIEKARAKNVRAEIVEIETFDALLLRMWRNLDDKPEALDAKVRRTTTAKASIPLPASGNNKPVLRLNAWPVHGCPEQCTALELTKEFSWGDLRVVQRNSEGSVICTKGDAIYVWGNASDVREAFGENLRGMRPHDLPFNLGEGSALHFKAFAEDALSVALSRGKPLLARKQRSGTWLIVDRNAEDISSFTQLFDAVGKITGKIAGLFAPETEDLPSEQVFWAEAARISIDQRDGKKWLTVDPDVWIWPARARRLASEFLDKRRGDRYNRKYNELLNAWEAILFGGDEPKDILSFSPFAEGSGIENPIFEIGVHSAYSRKLTV